MRAAELLRQPRHLALPVGRLALLLLHDPSHPRRRPGQRPEEQNPGLLSIIDTPFLNSFVFVRLRLVSSSSLHWDFGSREETHKIGRDKPKMLHSSRPFMVNLYFHCWQSLDQDFSGFLRSNFMSLVQRAL